ncbi:MAG: 2-C-methyl-D-erythritol 4-phosphate cytidylyltransferase [Lachnospiraceae bacterium]|nr:2-C-methyl-D-erythritol 4-phosphate cytidylyltransferase [Lachnospiraceae bacterium]
MGEKKIAAVCLAAGQGKRMESKVQKQYLLIQDKPVLYYSLKAFQDSPVEEVVLVVGAGEEEYCQKEIVEKYEFKKVKAIVAGGKERYHSVYHGLQAVRDADYVLIHDGARPFLTQEIIERCVEGAKEYRACVAGMPVKDTIKLADSEGNIESTPERSRVWMIQTPQSFEYSLIKDAYTRLIEQENKGIKTSIPVTDDAMVVEYFLNQKVHLVYGSYENIKITTPEDMRIAEAFLKK